MRWLNNINFFFQNISFLIKNKIEDKRTTGSHIYTGCIQNQFFFKRVLKDYGLRETNIKNNYLVQTYKENLYTTMKMKLKFDKKEKLKKCL